MIGSETRPKHASFPLAVCHISPHNLVVLWAEVFSSHPNNAHGSNARRGSLDSGMEEVCEDSLGRREGRLGKMGCGVWVVRLGLSGYLGSIGMFSGCFVWHIVYQ